MLNKIRVVCALLCVVAVPMLQNTAAHAHVLITDETNSMGAVLHITPDDDPIAGSSSHIFFDIQDDRYQNASYEANLAIVDQRGDRSDVDTDISGSYVSARYTFAAQGVYKLELTVRRGNASEIFTVNQRVSRGTSGDETSPAVRHGWAEALIVLSATGVGVLAVVWLSRLRRVVESSQ
ncbi:MAG: hypothetical protein UY35_C0010G0010 [Candidatus Saccharibacteria bacterium GW2011_GWC2_48_9]|nr:MAG: hypothetical protein UY35_C0010G0010 [Candidatus Saccharibacteria bacterium GW2011_GWC2_48_9]